METSGNNWISAAAWIALKASASSWVMDWLFPNFTAPGRSFAGQQWFLWHHLGQTLGRPKFLHIDLIFWWSRSNDYLILLLCWFFLKGFLCPYKGFLVWCAFVSLDQNLVWCCCIVYGNQTITWFFFCQRVTVWPWIMRSSIRTNVTTIRYLPIKYRHHLLQH